jgi:aldose 1-epimerase
MSGTPLSGTQHHIRAGDYEADVAAVGASLRSLRYDGRDLVIPFEADELRPVFRGATLAPWPNRVVDGRYEFEGRHLQLALSEPERGHALHGLAAWIAFDAVDVSEDTVELVATIQPQMGYPWRVQVETTYILGPAGLTQSVRATNLSDSRAPWGTGPHPYLVAGTGPVDDWILELPATLVLEVTEDRLAPLGLVAVDDKHADRFDYRSGGRIGAARIDHAFTGLAPASDGQVTVRLTAASGSGVTISWDSACPWVQIHTADLPGGAAQAGHRAGLAVEPMSCAPDAFNAGSYEHETGLLVLEPGVSTEAAWTIAAIR